VCTFAGLCGCFSPLLSRNKSDESEEIMLKDMTTRFAMSMLLVTFITPGAVAGQGRGRGHEKASGQSEKAKDAGKDKDKEHGGDERAVVFSPNERTVLNRYMRANRSNLPPGLAKRDRLPPGLERQVITRGTLPPGLRGHLVRVPADLDRQFSRLPSGYRRYFVGDDLVILDDRTGLIHAVIRDAFPR